MKGSINHKASVFSARKVRNAMLRDFLAADDATERLNGDALFGGIERPIAIAILTAMYQGLGVKMNEEGRGKVKGALDILEGDDIASAAGLWKPLKVTPAILALACFKLKGTPGYPPNSADVRVACEAARDTLLQAYIAAHKVRDKVVMANAILLEFDYAEWERPWLLPVYLPMRSRMLEMLCSYSDSFEAEARSRD
jgi:hypothetical protein